MYTLKDEQVDFIIADIEARGIGLDDLQQNLLDHICCILEQDVTGDNDFTACYNRTIRQFYKHDLAEIERETYSLLKFKNYYTLKRSMMISGVVSVVLFITAAIFKIMYWPGAGALFFLGIVLFSLLFLPLLVLLKTKEQKSGRSKTILLLAAAVAVLFSMANLFTIMRWEGANYLWYATIVTSACLLTPVYFFTGIRNPETRVNTIVITILLINGTGLLFTTVNVRKPLPLQTYTYYNYDGLLKRMMATPGADSMLLRNTALNTIYRQCDSLKTYILLRDIEMDTLPANASASGLIIMERNVFMPETSSSFALLARLRNNVVAYNTTQSDAALRIPIATTILAMEGGQLQRSSNFFALNSVTHIQLNIAASLQQQLLHMK